MKRTLLGLTVIGSAILVVVAVALFGMQTAYSQNEARGGEGRAVAQTQPNTKVEVYVLSRGGKFLGDDVGGAQVTLRDARSGELLATGRTRGGSGAEDLMTVARTRSEPISTHDAAVFTAHLELEEPRLIEVEIYGPPAAQNSANRVTTTQWVLPEGLAPAENKIVMEMPGLNVDVLSPPTHFLPQAEPPLEIPLRANVTMMCGCPIAPNYPWKPENYRVRALVLAPDGSREVVDLQFDTDALHRAPSQFIGTYNAKQSGIYEVVVFAQQAGTDNAGSDRVTFILP